ncbi:sodium/calcium exchanger regulatory protein 1-like [Tubulanus polymorphus]|uniref:sodium/calcium exchanger regulatory protein 1-like n=1 Tax=Tubulanus polymorphus TaxID=672921 RepID=UPI003DA63E73
MAASVTTDFSGSWKLDRSENFDKFLELLGEHENFMTRQMMKIARFAKPVQTIKQDGDKFNIETKSVVRTTVVDFKLGEEFEREEQGHKLKAKAELTDGKLVITQEPKDAESKLRKQKVAREIKDGELVMTIVLGDDECICTRVFKKVDQPAPAATAAAAPKNEKPKEEDAKQNDENAEGQ